MFPKVKHERGLGQGNPLGFSKDILTYTGTGSNLRCQNIYIRTFTAPFVDSCLTRVILESLGNSSAFSGWLLEMFFIDTLGIACCCQGKICII